MESTNYENIDINELESDVEQIETVQYVEVEDIEEVVVETDNAFAPFGSNGEIVKHNDLKDRDISDQHPISAITNLEKTLETLAIAQNIYTINGGIAEFREWASDPYGEGYFVSLTQKRQNELDGGNLFIDICKKVGPTNEITDVYGVTVSQSALCGYQNKEYTVLNPGFNNKAGYTSYAKVCLLGSVKVRVTADDYDEIVLAIANSSVYVVPDEFGRAKKSESGIGFKVLSTGQMSGVSIEPWYFVEIALVPQNDNISRVMAKIQKAQVDIDNIVVDLGNLNDKVDENINISGKFEDLKDAFDELDKNTTTQLQNAEEAAKEVAEQVVEQAESKIKTITDEYVESLSEFAEAQKNTNQALTDIADLRSNIQPLAQWAEANKTSVAGFVARADEDHASLQTLTSTFGEDGSSLTAVMQKINENGASIQHLVTHVDKYTLGPYSPTHNLSLEETSILSGEHIYVPTRSHQESSYIYKCTLLRDMEKAKFFFKLQEQTYMFETLKEYGQGTVLEYNSRVGQIIIGDDVIKTHTAKDITDMYELSFEIEYIFPIDAHTATPITFEEGWSYIWRHSSDRNRYEWQRYSQISVAETAVNGIEEGDLWYCVRGVIDEHDTNKYIYDPYTLYYWDKSYTMWRKVASLNDNSSSTMVGLVKQAADTLTSTYTNLKGDMSLIEQSVDEIRSQVQDQDSGMLTSIQQTAKDIRAGVYDPTKGSTELELLLGGMQSTSTHIGHIRLSHSLMQPDLNGVTRYSQPPVWNGKEFVFAVDSADTYGDYFFKGDDYTQYCKLVADGHETYIIGNPAVASLNTRVTDTESEVESWTLFQKGQNETITSIKQTSDEDDATISSMVYGNFRECVELKVDLTEDDRNNISNDRYADPPAWEDITTETETQKGFVFKGEKISNATYCPVIDIDGNVDTSCYYKLFYRDNIVVSYEKYAMKSSPYASIMQKVDENGSAIGLVAGNNEVEGKIFINTINNDESGVTIAADKISINGTTTFADIFNPGTTTISGGFIQSGVIRSNNYNGAEVKKIYGKRISYPKIYDGEESNYIYYVQLTAGTTYKMLLDPDAVYYIGLKIVNDTRIDYLSDSESIVKNSDGFYECKTACYMISESDFDLVGLFNDKSFEGLAIKLNDGKIISQNFVLDKDGVTLDGNIKLNGSITWAAQSNPVKVLYAEPTQGGTAPVKPPNEGEEDFKTYEDYPIGDIEGWHRIYSESDYYASYSYDDGFTWTEAIKIKGEDGRPGLNGNDGSDANVTFYNVFNALTNDGTQQGLFYYEGAVGVDSNVNGLYINASFIRSGIISGLEVQSGAFDPADKDTMLNLIQMKDGVFSMYTESTEELPKLKIGYGERSSTPIRYIDENGKIQEKKLTTTVPYIALGQGNGVVATDSLYGTAFYENQAVILKDSNGLMINYFPTGYSNDPKSISQQIMFYNKGENTQSRISFMNSTVDFTTADVTGLKITFG